MTEQITEADVGQAYDDEDLIPPVSNSELQTWIDCRRRWYLGFYRELAPEKAPLTGALALGIRVHVALQRKYANDEDPLEVYEELHGKAVYDLLMAEYTIGFKDKEIRKKLQAERELAHAMLEGYEAWCAETGLDEGLKFAGAEVVVYVASGIPGVRLRGKLDQRVYREAGGLRLFRDFKTAANLTDGPKMLPLDEQMKFYMMLEQYDAAQRTGGQPPEPTLGGLYTMLKKVKRTSRALPPFYSEVEVHHNDLEIESMRIRTHKRIEEMIEARQNLDADGDHRYWTYPRPSRDCAWKCPFFSVCPMMDDSRPEVWNAMLDQHFVKTDPYERYALEDATKS
jgi:hypothetical protein